MVETYGVSFNYPVPDELRANKRLHMGLDSTSDNAKDEPVLKACKMEPAESQEQNACASVTDSSNPGTPTECDWRPQFNKIRKPWT